MCCSCLFPGAVPGNILDYDSIEAWEADKKQRLDMCKRKEPKTVRAAKWCLRDFAEHRGTRTCVDTAAWLTRIEKGIE